MSELNDLTGLERAELRRTLCDYVKQIICGERQDAYGAPEQNFETISKFWSLYLGCPVTPVQVSNMMVLLKIARGMNNIAVLDNFLDAAGYSIIAASLEVKRHDPS